LKEASLSDEDIEKLDSLNRWPECLFPDDWRIARPFAAFLSEYEATDGNTSTYEKAFDEGIRRIFLLMSRLRMAELVEQIGMLDATFNFHRKLSEIRDKWWALEQVERSEISESFVRDPAILIECIIGFLKEGQTYNMLTLPFHGCGVRDSLLRAHVRSLESVLASMGELTRLSSFLALGDSGFISAIGLIVEEKEDFMQLIANLEDDQSPELKERVELCNDLLKSMTFTPPNLGRLRPQLLFAYARDSKSLEDMTLKDLLVKSASP